MIQGSTEHPDKFWWHRERVFARNSNWFRSRIRTQAFVTARLHHNDAALFRGTHIHLFRTRSKLWARGIALMNSVTGSPILSFFSMLPFDKMVPLDVLRIIALSNSRVVSFQCFYIDEQTCGMAGGLYGSWLEQLECFTLLMLLKSRCAACESLSCESLSCPIQNMSGILSI